MSADLPSSWVQRTLGDLAVEGPRNGYSGKTSNTATGTCTLRLGATTSGSFILDETTTKRMIETLPGDSIFWLEPGDLLVQRSNTREYVGTAAIYDGPRNSYIYPDLMMRLRFTRPETAAWVWRYLNSDFGRRQVRRLAAGSAGSMPKISGAKLRSVVMPLPPLPEQRRIAAILDEADALRRKRREALGLLDELLRSAFLEMFGDIAARRSPWPWGTCADAVRMSSGKSAKRVLSSEPTVIPVYGGNGVNGYATEALFEEPVVVVGRVGQQCGITHLTDGPCWVTDNAIVVRVIDSDCLDPVYLAAAFQHAPIRDTVTRLDLPFINQGMLREQLIPMPPIEAQREYVRFREGVLAGRRRAETASKETHGLFDALLHRAFSGEL